MGLRDLWIHEGKHSGSLQENTNVFDDSGTLIGRYCNLSKYQLREIPLYLA